VCYNTPVSRLNEENGVLRFKKLWLIATVVFVLAWLLVFVASPVYASPSWVSFNDAAHSTTDDDFAGSETTVYMQGIVTASTQYKVAYYEADTGAEDTADLVETDIVTSNVIGVLESECTFTDYPTSDAGTWHSVVFPSASTPPSTYDPTGSVEDDSFNVQASAIPEFPTVITMIAAMGLSFGIYYWLRRRHHRQMATVNLRR
jgi:hypothetical protein